MVIYILTVAILLVILYAVFSPDKYPKNIPKISIWVTLHDAVFPSSRLGFYNKYARGLAEQHGAFMLWKLGEWTVQITKPEYLMQMFRDDVSFIRTGSYVKVPWGPLGELFGENIIDSDGAIWKQQREVLAPAIQRKFDIAHMKKKSQELRAALWQDHEMRDSGFTPGIIVEEPTKDWALSICCHYFFGVNIESLPEIESRLVRYLAGQRSGLVSGISTFYPFLQRFTWFFPQIRRAFHLARVLDGALVDLAKSNTDTGCDMDSNTVKDRLNSARKEGVLSDFHYRSNLKQTFLAGFDEVEAAFLSTVSRLAKNPQIQSALHAELSSVPVPYTLKDLDGLPILFSVILETLRLHPPFPQLTNRCTAQQVVLGNDITIPAGTRIGWNAYAVQTNTNVWGEDALVFRPERWGKDIETINVMFRTQQSKATFIPWGSRSRTCLGISFALMQLKVGIYELFSELEWGIHEGSTPAMRQGPIANPSGHRYTLKKRKC